VRAAETELTTRVPSWRSDVAGEIDLVEEVARFHGYDNFPTEIRPFRPTSTHDDPMWTSSNRVREAMVGMGFLEARPMPFVAGGEGFARLSNPLSENEAFLRRDVLDTLSRRAEYNLSRMQGNVRLFEIGSAFEPRGGELPHEELHAGVLVMGRRTPPHFSDPKSPEFQAWATYDQWDAKALAEVTASAAYPGKEIRLRQSDKPGLLWEVSAGGTDVGIVRRLQLDAPVWASPAFGVEISLGVVDATQVAPAGQSAYRPPIRPTPAVSRYQPTPTTPASEFDLALVVPESVRGEQIEALIQRVSGKLLERVELFDRYVGHGVEAGHRSLAWRLTFRHAERTLRDREIEARRSDILKALADELNVRQRSA